MTAIYDEIKKSRKKERKCIRSIEDFDRSERVEIDFDAIEAPETESVDLFLAESLEKSLSSLTKQESEVLKMRFFDEETLSTIGKRFGVSVTRVRQIEGKALRKLRHPTRIERLTPFFNDIQSYALSLTY